jgi:hypothetical protein
VEVEDQVAEAEVAAVAADRRISMNRISMVVVLIASLAGAQRSDGQAKILTIPSTALQENASVQGTLQYGEFLGPPGYGEKPSSDRKEFEFYLQLPAPVTQQKPDLRLGPEFEKQNEFFVQVRTSSSAMTARLRRLIGRKVSVSGSLEASTIGHDRTGIIINADKVAAITDWRW